MINYDTGKSINNNDDKIDFKRKKHYTFVKKNISVILSSEWFSSSLFGIHLKTMAKMIKFHAW